MPYLGATELSLILPANIAITGSSTPFTLDEVASVIAEGGYTVDAYAAARGYNVPVPPTATIAYGLVQQIVKNYVGWRVLGAIFPNIGGPGDKTSLAADYRDAYRDAIKALKSGDLDLVDVGTSTTQGGRALPRSFSTSETATGAASPMIPLAWEP